MSNKEKAQEIAKRYGVPCHGMGDCEFEAYQSALEMAQWKDEQFEKQKRQLIDKACEWLKNNIDEYYTTNEFEEWFDDMFEDFKQAMKGE